MPLSSWLFVMSSCSRCQGSLSILLISLNLCTVQVEGSNGQNGLGPCLNGQKYFIMFCFISYSNCYMFCFISQSNCFICFMFISYVCQQVLKFCLFFSLFFMWLCIYIYKLFFICGKMCNLKILQFGLEQVDFFWHGFEKN